jgi:hypothetical protein
MVVIKTFFPISLDILLLFFDSKSEKKRDILTTVSVSKPTGETHPCQFEEKFEDTKGVIRSR